MSKQITYAGYSRVAGVLKFRTATDEKRIEQLAKLGDTDINIVELPVAVSNKNEAVKSVLALFGNASAEVTDFLVSQAKDENPFAKPKAVKKAKTVKATNVKVKSSKVEDVKMTAAEAAQIRAEFNARLREVYEAN